jgi:Flp pilus assembly protein TadG
VRSGVPFLTGTTMSLPCSSSPTPSSLARQRWAGALAALRRDEGGVAALQFALVAAPFLALLFAILETALVFWAGQVLQTAVTDTARDVYTGTFQLAHATSTPAQTKQDIKAAICTRVVAMFDCATKLTIDVKTYPLSSGFPTTLPSPIVVDSNGNRGVDPNFGQYSNPVPNQIVLVRAIVLYPVYVSLLGSGTSNLNGTTRVLMGSAAFQTEPYN